VKEETQVEFQVLDEYWLYLGETPPRREQARTSSPREVSLPARRVGSL
jgi:hypothetical protein